MTLSRHVVTILCIQGRVHTAKARTAVLGTKYPKALPGSSRIFPRLAASAFLGWTAVTSCSQKSQRTLLRGRAIHYLCCTPGAYPALCARQGTVSPATAALSKRSHDSYQVPLWSHGKKENRGCKHYS